MKKRVLITGASRGIGKAIASLLLEEGYEVIGLARSFEKFPKHPHFIGKEVDLSQLDKLPEFLQKLSKEFPQIDALICNAGKWHFGNFEEMSYTQIRSLIDLNFLSHAFLIRTFLPLMKKQGQGDIIFIGSESGLTGKRQQSIYSASKCALRGFAQALRSECATREIRICTIHPGLVRSDFYEEADFQPSEESSHHILPTDIAELIHFILKGRAGTVLDEIVLSPQKHRLERKKTIENVGVS